MFCHRKKNKVWTWIRFIASPLLNNNDTLPFQRIACPNIKINLKSICESKKHHLFNIIIIHSLKRTSTFYNVGHNPFGAPLFLLPVNNHFSELCCSLIELCNWHKTRGDFCDLWPADTIRHTPSECLLERAASSPTTHASTGDGSGEKQCNRNDRVSRSQTQRK